MEMKMIRTFFQSSLVFLHATLKFSLFFSKWGSEMSIRQKLNSLHTLYGYTLKKVMDSWILIVEKDTFFIFATYRDNSWWESEIPKPLEE